MNLIDFNRPKKCQIAIDDQELVSVIFSSQKGSFDDVQLEFIKSEFGYDLLVKSERKKISHIYLTYDLSIGEEERSFGDSFERTYGDVTWTKPSSHLLYYWYFFIKKTKQKQVNGYGVKVQPHSIVSFRLKNNQLIVDVNTQSGGCGVNLKGRLLNAATFIQESYQYDVLETALKRFTKKLMGDIKPRPVPQPVYGFNNWYYAYGVSSYELVMEDTKLLAEVTKGLKNRPFMVIDDGWSIESASGPWITNDRFKDMSLLVKEMKKYDVRPGLWFRPLMDKSEELKEHRHPLEKDWYDLSSKEVLYKVTKDVKMFVNWGFELIKFDYMTYDTFHYYGFNMPEEICPQGWHYEDDSLTNAELTLRLYQTIRDAAPNAILIGCNAIGHLCAGIVEVNRIGDDTSGREWDRTLKMGVNTLAYRLIQNHNFYVVDADCVGITGLIDWKQNRQWLDLLAYSGSPLFISCDPRIVSEEIKKDMQKAFKINEKQENNCYPIDVDDNFTPHQWCIDRKLKEFDWYLK